MTGRPANRYELMVAQAPAKAAAWLDRSRRRLAELEGGAAPSGTFDSIDVRRGEVDGLTAALAAADIVLCADCKERLRTPLSRARGVGPKCWAKRLARERATR